jgi:hypothetical protein
MAQKDLSMPYCVLKSMLALFAMSQRQLNVRLSAVDPSRFALRDLGLKRLAQTIQNN